ncbi:MAG: SOS response-associated peptidase family protein [Alphaproteobacteria bacterium]|nr:SOS response-associated peptidase family protein [Alphaproteobacteria bacterium]
MTGKPARGRNWGTEMCGKFTTRAHWAQIVDLAFAQPANPGDEDSIQTFRVMDILCIIAWDATRGMRRLGLMRWGFPHPQDFRRPQPIHARGETVDTVPAFADAFRDGQRGIVLVNSFNEAPDKGGQHVITPAGPIGIAFVWRRFEIAGQLEPLFACVMVTVPANTLLTGLPTDRMPAVLAPEDWETWLAGSPGAAKACLKTVEDVRWTMAPEQRKSARRAKPMVSDPGGLF